MQFEYVVFDHHEEDQNKLTEKLRMFGEERWELVSDTETRKDSFISRRYIFKRPKQREDESSCPKEPCKCNCPIVGTFTTEEIRCFQHEPKECKCAFNETGGLLISCPKHNV